MSLRKVRYRTEPLAEVNITNLIDVVMVLLIMFILVSNFVTTGLHVTVPQVRYVEATGKEQIVVGVDALGNFTLNEKMVNEEEMAQGLAELKLVHPEESIYVHADAKALYETIAKVISSAREAGFNQVNLPMQQMPTDRR
ncbi:MAG: biopolymer transporter ExbD [bacterium]|mgnify:CR=1 FL=1|nr:biopolymer transporter ExbD [bacterium]